MRAHLSILACCAALAVLGGCGRAQSPTPAAEPVTAAVREVSDFSVYELDAGWTDQAGRARPLASLKGRPQVVAMVYTTCTHTCPSILAEMKRLEAGVPGVGFVFVSLDPEQDTPAQLAGYAAGARLDAERWTLLTGDGEQVRELAALLGVRYRDESAGQISHSNAYFVLDGEGRIVHRQVGLGSGTASVIALLQSMTAGA